MVRNFQKSGDGMMCGDKSETVEMEEAQFDRTINGVFNAGRYEQVLDRKLSDDEFMMFTEGFIPATVQEEIDFTELGSSR